MTTPVKIYQWQDKTGQLVPGVWGHTLPYQWLLLQNEGAIDEITGPLKLQLYREVGAIWWSLWRGSA